MMAKSLEIRIPEQLPKTQREVLRMLAAGETAKATAMAMKISHKTVEWHRMELMKRVGLFDYASLTRFAVRIGLVELDV